MIFSELILYTSAVELTTKTAPNQPDALIYSIIAIESELFVVRGKGKNSCERFDVIEKQWKQMSNLKNGERKNCGLILYNDHLYAIFGWNRTGCIDSIERINIRKPKALWEVFPYKNPEKLNLPMYAFAILPQGSIKTQFLLLGGKTDIETLKRILILDLKDSSFRKFAMNLETNCSFREIQFVKLYQGCYGQFDNEQQDQICYIQK